MSLRAFYKAQTMTKKMYKQLWEDLSVVINEEYDVKEQTEDSLLIRIKGEQKADIEVARTGSFIYVGLWYYTLPEYMNGRHDKTNFYNSVEVIMEINSILSSVKEAQEFYKLDLIDQQDTNNWFREMR